MALIAVSGTRVQNCRPAKDDLWRRNWLKNLTFIPPRSNCQIHALRGRHLSGPLSDISQTTDTMGELFTPLSPGTRFVVDGLS
jgi:hypothetical protein